MKKKCDEKKTTVTWLRHIVYRSFTSQEQKWAVAYHAPNDGKASTFYSDQFNKGEFELVALYSKSGENVSRRVMRKVT